MRFIYEQTDLGTERRLRLVDDAGRDLVPARDPFWPAGIPASAGRRRARMCRVMGEMKAENYRRVMGREAPGDCLGGETRNEWDCAQQVG